LTVEKAPDAFRTISEAAEELDVPQHVLRFWETRFAQIKPMKRAGGRRYYRPADVELLKGIRTLLYGEGYTIRGVQRILKEEGVAHVAGVEAAEVAARKRDADLDGAPPPAAPRRAAHCQGRTAPGRRTCWPGPAMPSATRRRSFIACRTPSSIR
jgi:DNA-binding transcriptional MerR regulator